jgi:hypothetical protein
MTYKNGNVYEGTWLLDKPHGRGKMTYKNGDVYEGEWLLDKPHGQGKMRYQNGDVYEGTWSKGIPNGQGKMRYKNGSVSEGVWESGNLTTVDANESLKYIQAEVAKKPSGKSTIKPSPVTSPGSTSPPIIPPNI